MYNLGNINCFLHLLKQSKFWSKCVLLTVLTLATTSWFLHGRRWMEFGFSLLYQKYEAAVRKLKQFGRFYLPSVPQHGVFGLWQLLTTDDLYQQLFLHLTWKWILQVGIKVTCLEANLTKIHILCDFWYKKSCLEYKGVGPSHMQAGFSM